MRPRIEAKLNSYWSSSSYEMQRFFTALIGGIAILIVVAATLHGMSEVDMYDYSRIQRHADYAIKRIPEYGPALKKVLADEKITEWEYDTLRDIENIYQEKKDAAELAKTKADLKQFE